MPTYGYECRACGHQHEILQKITEAHLTECPECGKDALQRGPGGGIGLSFKGSGFYITDYQNAPAAKECCPCGKNKGSCETG